ncbi:MAG: transcriptional regulator [Turicibacter sp.]|nr:transcriptional regulator [Turicibacter sp.]
MNIPKNLRYLREKKGVKPKDIAKATKLDAQAIYKWENNKLLPDDDQLKKISAYYGVDIVLLKNTDLKETTKPILVNKTIAEKSPTTLSKNIRDLRSGVLKINRRALAAKVGVTEDEVSHWEHGELIPDPDTMEELAELFGTTVDELHAKAPVQKNHLKSVKKPELPKKAIPSRPLPKNQVPIAETTEKSLDATAEKLNRILSFASTLHDLTSQDLEKLETFVKFLRFEKDE